MLHLDQFSRSFIHKKFYRILITHPVSAGNGIVDVVFQRIVIFDNSRSAALRRHSVASHGIDLAHHSYTQVWARIGDGNGCSESCTPSAYHNNVVTGYHFEFR
jgi:hypothetical protein